jgi:tRNA 5-methylaminomethyl-2-thiouridine biosynthesis bifunctional protein
LKQTIHLDIGSGSSQIFLRQWQAWRSNPQRTRMLHVVAASSESFQNTSTEDSLKALAEELQAQLWGLLPGFHRLVFDGGQVLLTLCIGDLAKVLRQQQFEADSIDFDHAAFGDADALHAAKAVARLCGTGTRLRSSNVHAGMQAALRQCGFVTQAGPDELQAIYNPAWLQKVPQPVVQPGRCVVVGAGLAGAAVASSLARRGWTVTVLDTAHQPASGASGLPAGLLVAHTSPDDNPLSRLSRCGVRITLQQARTKLKHGTDWGHTGVLQRALGDAAPSLPGEWAQSLSGVARNWCYPASGRTLTAVDLPPDSQAVWHAQAGWVKPAALVRAWLGETGVSWQGNASAAKITATDQGWQVQDAYEQVLVQADLVVVCAGYASQALVASTDVATPDLQAIRGQVTFGLNHPTHSLPPFAVNGHGGFIPAITTPDGPMWLMGAGYERDVLTPDVKPQDHADNLARLQTLLPHAAAALADQFIPQQAQGWAGIRCATHNRLPLVSSLGQPDTKPGLWLCTGMGSRGLSFAALCGELLAARLHGEPLPVDNQLAKAMGAGPV